MTAETLPTPEVAFDPRTIHTCGVDVGSSTVKAAVFRDGPAGPRRLALYAERIRRRDPRQVVRQAIASAIGMAGLPACAIDYLASTGEGDLVEGRTGHFWGMTTHARGAIHLVPEGRAVLDLGALHARAIRVDARSKVLGHKMTSRCASGSGQFLENIARYLGVPLDEVGEISARAKAPEAPSSVCAVLSETDCINMVSRGVSAPDILKGIHMSMAGRCAKLLSGVQATGVVAVTGGLSANRGLLDALAEEVAARSPGLEIRTHPDAVHAGAIGAALWAAFRWRRTHPIQGASR